ncbi:MAG: hypothetical protein IPK68_22265 [Bdellovibrionales bacterium]|nr:hypothetical protein [Bdellovibrionales bacterium]
MMTEASGELLRNGSASRARLAGITLRLISVASAKINTPMIYLELSSKDKKSVFNQETLQFFNPGARYLLKISISNAFL